MRNLAERITSIRPLQTAFYWMQFILAITVLTFPLTVYEGYYRSTSTACSTRPSVPGFASS